MERTTILPYEWFNKMVRVSAYSGEERRSEFDCEGISEPQHVMVRDYVGRLVNADETGLLLVLRRGFCLLVALEEARFHPRSPTILRNPSPLRVEAR